MEIVPEKYTHNYWHINVNITSCQTGIKNIYTTDQCVGCTSNWDFVSTYFCVYTKFEKIYGRTCMDGGMWRSDDFTFSLLPQWGCFTHKIFSKCSGKQCGYFVSEAAFKRCSENMQQVYRRTPMPKCDFKTGEYPCRSVILIKLNSNFVEITLRHGCLL